MKCECLCSSVTANILWPDK